jgi:hypothetical protein
MRIALSGESDLARRQGTRGGIEEDQSMKTPTVLAAILALASLPLVAQQPPTDNQQTTPNPATEPSNPPGQQSDRPAATPDQPSTPQATPRTPQSTPPDSAAAPESSAASVASAAPVAELRPVNGELISKLDTKTAKTGDDVVVQTKASVKTADGTEIPKGSKLVGHVVAVQPSASGQNSQVALKFDHAELDGGQTLAIQSQIQSIGSGGAGSDAAAPPSRGSAPEPPTSANPATPGSGASGATNAPGYTPGYTPSSPGAASSSPAAGTVVARNGKIAIQTTNIPDVLLANNEPGQQDPRMEQASSILLGAKKDVQLEGGTPVVMALAVAPGAPGSPTK